MCAGGGCVCMWCVCTGMCACVCVQVGCVYAVVCLYVYVCRYVCLCVYVYEWVVCPRGMSVCVWVYVSVDQEEGVMVTLMLLSACDDPGPVLTPPHVFNITTALGSSYCRSREVGYLPEVTASGSGRDVTLLVPLRSLRAELWQIVF